MSNIISKVFNDLKNGTSYSVEYLMSNDVESTLSKHGIKIRKIFSPIIRKAYLTQTTYKLIKEPNMGKITKKSKIYVMNHRQGDDVVLGVNAINDNAYVIFGNEHLMMETLDGLGVWANGGIPLLRYNNESRKAAYDKMKYVIENGGNIWIYPEGYWNLDDEGLSDGIHPSDCHNSECWLIQDFNIGCFRLAQETGAPLIPVVLHYDEVNGKKCYSRRGNEFYIYKDDDVFEKKDEFITIMNTMKYELMEKYSSYNREELEKNGVSLKEQWISLKKELVDSCVIDRINYKLDLLDEKRIGKAKVANPVISNEEAFAHLDRINITSENAYLLSKKLSGLKR